MATELKPGTPEYDAAYPAGSWIRQEDERKRALAENEAPVEENEESTGESVPEDIWRQNAPEGS